MHPRAYFFLALFVLSLFVDGTNAQTIVGRISGTVTDVTGANIPGAAVKVTNEAT